MTALFPASAVLLESFSHEKDLTMKVFVEWSPRSENNEADSFANGDSSDFSPSIEDRSRSPPR